MAKCSRLRVSAALLVFVWVLAGCVSSLIIAASLNDVDEIGRLVDGGEPVDVVDHTGRTPLIIAAIGELTGPMIPGDAEHVEAVELLLAPGADPNRGDGYGTTALHMAARFGRIATGARGAVQDRARD